MTRQRRPTRSLSIALVGKGGSGVITAGDILLAAAAKAGYYGIMTRAVGPQIRGGEAAALLRIGCEPLACLNDHFDILLGLDWLHAERFRDELPLEEDSLVISDTSDEEIPAELLAQGAALTSVNLSEIAEGIDGGRANMVALGLLASIAGIPADSLAAAIGDQLGEKGIGAIAASRACAEQGFALGTDIPFDVALEPAESGTRWRISGNQAAGLGALRGGVRFAAAYPITPATELLEWLAPRLHEAGGTLVQAEDELASINMAIGASYGGIPSLTATSGPGFSLMIEGIGLAVAAEVPVVVVNVMRGGPSTGIPTKSEQADLNAAVYGLHGDAPHLVLAANSVTDCAFTTQWAVHLAEATQSPAIVLTDQFLGQATMVADPIADLAFIAGRKLAENPSQGEYRRYAITADGISPVTLPGTAGGQYTADGLEHSARALPSSAAADHLAQSTKRAAKLTHFNYGAHWADIEGDSNLAVITWGSTTCAVREALTRLRAEGIELKLIAPRLLLPAQPERFTHAIADVDRIIVIEQNHGGQLYQLLRANYELPRDVQTFHRSGPVPLRPGEIAARLRSWRDA